MKKGFTLIELLVVIAIIGILSGVVLTSLGTARSKGSDAAVKGDLDGIRSAAEVYYDAQTPKSYSNLCADASITNPLNAAKAAGTGAGNCAVSSDNSAWVAYAQLKSSTAYWCIDSTGAATSTAAAPAGTSCAS